MLLFHVIRDCFNLGAGNPMIARRIPNLGKSRRFTHELRLNMHKPGVLHVCKCINGTNCGVYVGIVYCACLVHRLLEERDNLMRP